jgi:AraC-like DNA-binding protein
MPVGGVLLLGGGFQRCDLSWSRSHWQFETFGKFYFVTAGAATYETDDAQVSLEPGRIYFFPPHRRSRHHTRRLELHWFHFSVDSPVLDARLARVRAIESWSARAWEAWKPVYTRLAEHFAQGGEELGLRLQALALHGFAEVIARHPESEVPELTAMRERFAPALAFMEANFKRNPPLREIAASAGLSVPHFHRGFRRAFRTTPHEHMLRRRMDLAQQLLSGTGDAVGQIARTCGYEDQFYFSRVFTRWSGLSPERFRKRRDRP